MNPRAALLALLLPSLAGAECAMIRPFVCPCGVEELPPNPRLHLFWPRRRPEKAPSLSLTDGKGRPVKHRLVRASRSPAYDAYAVEVEAKAGTQLRASFAPDAYGLSSSWRVSATPKSGLHPPDGRLEVKTSTWSWACSFERAELLEMPRHVSVYRVDWTAEGGGKGSLVLPARPEWWWGAPKPDDPLSTKLLIGHGSCLGWTYPWDERPLSVSVHGLHPDRSEDAEVRLGALGPPPLLDEGGGWKRGAYSPGE